jgi:hypothetical protein
MPPVPPLNSPRQDTTLYFAYGANISSKTLNKRGLGTVPPPRQAQVIQPNIALVFGHRGGYATLLEVDYTKTESLGTGKSLKQKWWQWQQLPPDNDTTGSPLNSRNKNPTSTQNSANLVYWQPYGMLYELTKEQLQLIEAKEIGYQRKTILVTTTTMTTTDASMTNTGNDNKLVSLEATVFVSAPYMSLRHPVAPTQRYRDLILQGAIENKLPQNYIDWMEHLPVVEDMAVLGSAEYSNTLAEAALKVLGGAVVLVGISSMFVGH